MTSLDSSAAPLLSRRSLGAISVFGGTISYCVMDAFVKLVANSFSVFEVTFFRMAFSVELRVGNTTLQDQQTR